MVCKCVKRDGKLVCYHSGKPHVQLTGVNKKGCGFMTKLAQSYPEGFAKLAVQLLTT